MTLILCDIIFKNGSEFNLCNFDDEVFYKSKLYLRGGGFKISAIEYTIDTRPANFQIKGSFQDIFKKYLVKDVLEAELKLINYANKEVIFIGRVTQVSSEGGYYIMDVASLKCQLSANILQRYSKTCRAEFCDSKCGLLSDNYLQTIRVSRKEGHILYLEGKTNHDFTHGFLLNGTEKIPIINHDQEKIELLYQYEGEQTQVTLLAGCDKTIATCTQKYKNAVNFRGEPWVPEVS